MIFDKMKTCKQFSDRLQEAVTWILKRSVVKVYSSFIFKKFLFSLLPKMKKRTSDVHAEK